MDFGNQGPGRTTLCKKMPMATVGAASIIAIVKVIADRHRNGLLSSAQVDIAWQVTGRYPNRRGGRGLLRGENFGKQLVRLVA